MKENTLWYIYLNDAESWEDRELKLSRIENTSVNN